MKISNLQLKKLNITALFDKVDQSSITSESIRDLFGLKPQDKANSPFIDLPGTKVLIIPTLKKEVVIEPNRIQVSDIRPLELGKSRVVSDFKKVFEAFRGKATFRAYGFNYYISLELLEKVPYDKLLSPSLRKLINGGKLQEAGARVTYKKGNLRIDIQLVPGGQEKQLDVHANIHHETNEIDFAKLSGELLANYKEIRQAIEKFVKG